MKLVLPTIPSLLRRYFEPTRQVLLGPGQELVVERTAQPVTIFDAADWREVKIPRVVPPKISPPQDLLSQQLSRRQNLAQQLEQQLGGSEQAGQKSAASVTAAVATAPTVSVTAAVTNLFVQAKKGLKNVLKHLSLGVAILCLIIGAIFIIPDLYYKIVPADTEMLQLLEKKTTQVEAEQQAEPVVSPTPSPTPYLPPQNPNLPEGDWIIVPRIGVRTEYRATINPDEALNQGVWRVPEYGEPGDTNLPMIMAAHRFGWDWWWQSDYWKYHSFYKLPELEPGDTVEIISDQRKWVYQIYAGEQGEEITDYEADLILYTCKFLNSPIRYVRYANLVVE